jgi:ribosomal protein S18 acetylase RimI-like enzyme
MPDIEIAPLRLDEVEALVELAGSIWRAHYPGIISLEQIDHMLEQRYRPALVRQYMARGDLWLAARADGALVGFAHGHPLADGDYKLDKLYVDLDWQRQGIGGALINEVAARASRRGFARLVLRVNRNNQQAIDAYLKQGFTVATIHLEDIGGGFVMDDYVMTKELP